MGCDAFSGKMTMSTALPTTYPQVHLQSPAEYKTSLFDLQFTCLVVTLFTQFLNTYNSPTG